MLQNARGRQRFFSERQIFNDVRPEQLSNEPRISAMHRQRFLTVPYSHFLVLRRRHLPKRFLDRGWRAGDRVGTRHILHGLNRLHRNLFSGRRIGEPLQGLRPEHSLHAPAPGEHASVRQVSNVLRREIIRSRFDRLVRVLKLLGHPVLRTQQPLARKIITVEKSGNVVVPLNGRGAVQLLKLNRLVDLLAVLLRAFHESAVGPMSIGVINRLLHFLHRFAPATAFSPFERIQVLAPAARFGFCDVQLCPPVDQLALVRRPVPVSISLPGGNVRDRRFTAFQRLSLGGTLLLERFGERHHGVFLAGPVLIHRRQFDRLPGIECNLAGSIVGTVKDRRNLLFHVFARKHRFQVVGGDVPLLLCSLLHLVEGGRRVLYRYRCSTWNNFGPSLRRSRSLSPGVRADIDTPGFQFRAGSVQCWDIFTLCLKCGLRLTRQHRTARRRYRALCTHLGGQRLRWDGLASEAGGFKLSGRLRRCLRCRGFNQTLRSRYGRSAAGSGDKLRITLVLPPGGSSGADGFNGWSRLHTPGAFDPGFAKPISKRLGSVEHLTEVLHRVADRHLVGGLVPLEQLAVNLHGVARALRVCDYRPAPSIVPCRNEDSTIVDLVPERQQPLGERYLLPFLTRSGGDRFTDKLWIGSLVRGERSELPAGFNFRLAEFASLRAAFAGYRSRWLHDNEPAGNVFRANVFAERGALRFSASLIRELIEDCSECGQAPLLLHRELFFGE